ncbi:MAG: DMT family transporter [Erysipelotrichaceae bacterium]
MYSILSMLAGAIVSFMILMNGELSNVVGVLYSTLIVHIVGVVVAILVCKANKQTISIKSSAPIWSYFGGVIGVFTTVASSFCVGTLSITNIVALCLLGQTLTSIVCDQFGFFTSNKKPFQAFQLAGLSFAFIGIFWMLDFSAIASMTAMLVALLSGVSIVLSRFFNARLALATSDLRGSYLNHVTGLFATMFIMIIVRPSISSIPSSLPLWIFLGGALGVGSTLLYNVTSNQLSSYQVTIFSFLGQIATSFVLDALMGYTSSPAAMQGTLWILLGLLLNMVLSITIQKKKTQKLALQA